MHVARAPNDIIIHFAGRLNITSKNRQYEATVYG